MHPCWCNTPAVEHPGLCPSAPRRQRLGAVWFIGLCEFCSSRALLVILGQCVRAVVLVLCPRLVLWDCACLPSFSCMHGAGPSCSLPCLVWFCASLQLIGQGRSTRSAAAASRQRCGSQVPWRLWYALPRSTRYFTTLHAQKRHAVHDCHACSNTAQSQHQPSTAQPTAHDYSAKSNAMLVRTTHGRTSADFIKHTKHNRALPSYIYMHRAIRYAWCLLGSGANALAPTVHRLL